MKTLKPKVSMSLAGEVKIRDLKAAIEAFQRPLKNSTGQLPKKFQYPKQIIERVAALKSCGLNPGALALALGLSRPSVDNWLRSKRAKKLIKKPLASARELVIRDVVVPKVCLDSARILFRTGIVIEMRPETITHDLVRYLNGETRQGMGPL